MNTTHTKQPHAVPPVPADQSPRDESPLGSLGRAIGEVVTVPSKGTPHPLPPPLKDEPED